MQMVVDFLLEYYVWVLIVLVILLITVVGFLADTKRKKKLREKSESETTNNNSIPTNDLNTMNQGMDMNYNSMNQNMNILLYRKACIRRGRPSCTLRNI